MTDTSNRADEAQAQIAETFQARVDPWMIACFGATIARDRAERNHRFIEEALELVQANDCTRDEAHQLVDYVFGRPAGEPAQEVGGVMVTLAALCLASGLDMHEAAEVELARIWTKVEQIRAKQAAKPRHSPLPAAPESPVKVLPEAGGSGAMRLDPQREALLRHPTIEGALAHWDYGVLGSPLKPDAPLAGVHKARLRWAGATPEMIAESRAWLAQHGYGSAP